jgi:hypothetical protein
MIGPGARIALMIYLSVDKTLFERSVSPFETRDQSVHHIAINFSKKQWVCSGSGGSVDPAIKILTAPVKT